MDKNIKILVLPFIIGVPLVFLFIIISNLHRVEPNEIGVQMLHAGQNGKQDFSYQKGYVLTLLPTTFLYKVPVYELRGNLNDKITLKSADNSEIYVTPVYTYKIRADQAVEVVLNHLHVIRETPNNYKQFMLSIEDNILEPRIIDILRELSRTFTTDKIMVNGGTLAYEKKATELISKEFTKRGLELLTFSSQINFTTNVSRSIDERNKSSTQKAIIEQEIEKQKKINELTTLKAEELKIIDGGLNSNILKNKFIDKWDGKAPLYCSDLNLIKDISK